MLDKLINNFLPQKILFAQKNAAVVPVIHASNADKNACKIVNIKIFKIRFSAEISILNIKLIFEINGNKAETNGIKKSKNVQKKITAERAIKRAYP